MTETKPPLTRPQARVLRILADADPDQYGDPSRMAPRDVARAMWPDSPAWGKRTARYGANRNGATGGTMPMKAATMLWRMWPHYTSNLGDYGAVWTINPAGARALAEHEENNP